MRERRPGCGDREILQNPGCRRLVRHQALAAFLHKLETCDTDLVITLRVDELFSTETRRWTSRNIRSTRSSGDHVYQAAEFSIRTHAYESEFGMNGMAYKTRLLRDMGFRLPEGINYTDTLYCFPALFAGEGLRCLRPVPLPLPHRTRRAVGGKRKPEEEPHANRGDGGSHNPTGWTPRPWGKHVRKNQAYFVDGAVNFCPTA